MACLDEIQGKGVCQEMQTQGKFWNNAAQSTARIDPLLFYLKCSKHRPPRNHPFPPSVLLILLHLRWLLLRSNRLLRSRPKEHSTMPFHVNSPNVKK